MIKKDIHYFLKLWLLLTLLLSLISDSFLSLVLFKSGFSKSAYYDKSSTEDSLKLYLK